MASISPLDRLLVVPAGILIRRTISLYALSWRTTLCTVSLREKGGARYSPLEGALYFMTYRDPIVYQRKFITYDDTIEFASSLATNITETVFYLPPIVGTGAGKVGRIEGNGLTLECWTRRSHVLPNTAYS